jgi:hypothetical protein
MWCTAENLDTILLLLYNVSAAGGGAVGFWLQPDEPVPNAQLTGSSIEELVAALKEQAGPENAARLKTLLTSIQQFQQRGQQQQQSAQPESAPAGNAKAEGAAPTAAAAAAAAGSSDAKPAAQDQLVLEAYLLPIKDKQTRKVRRQDRSAHQACLLSSQVSRAQHQQLPYPSTHHTRWMNTSPAHGADGRTLRVGFGSCCADNTVLQAVHNFLKSDPRLPPLETDTVAAATGPEAAEAAAAGAAVEAAADVVKPPWEQVRALNRRFTAEQSEQKNKEESEALNIIRVRLAGDMQGLRRKRGIAAQNNQQKVRHACHAATEAQHQAAELVRDCGSWCFACFVRVC